MSIKDDLVVEAIAQSAQPVVQSMTERYEEDLHSRFRAICKTKKPVDIPLAKFCTIRVRSLLDSIESATPSQRIEVASRILLNVYIEGKSSVTSRF